MTESCKTPEHSCVHTGVCCFIIFYKKLYVTECSVVVGAFFYCLVDSKQFFLNISHFFFCRIIKYKPHTHTHMVAYIACMKVYLPYICNELHLIFIKL